MLLKPPAVVPTTGPRTRQPDTGPPSTAVLEVWLAPQKPGPFSDEAGLRWRAVPGTTATWRVSTEERYRRTRPELVDTPPAAPADPPRAADPAPLRPRPDMSTSATSRHRGGATGPLTAAVAPRPRQAHTPTRLGHLLLHCLAHRGEFAHRVPRRGDR